MHVLNHLRQRRDAANLLRRHVTSAAKAALDASRRRRLGATTLADWLPLRERWLASFRALFPPELLAMRGRPLHARTIARRERSGYAVETVLFESLWGWQVNAHLYLPAGQGPWPAVVVPTGHSAKTNRPYQIPPLVFARNGFVAITFDSPGQGEKAAGNDHFDRGMACLLTGLWSETFFVMDALRAIDYLASRPEVALSSGVGMTGVSGGGDTTIACALLDERIRCIAPVCCIGPQRVLLVEDLYTQCPETVGPGLIAAGVDLTERLALAAPIPCLIVSGELDEVFYRKMVRQAVSELRRAYALYQKTRCLEHFEQPGAGHDYTTVMAQRVAAWMRRWLVNDRPAVRAVPDPEAALEPAEVINCGPNPERNMHTINAERAAALAARRPSLSPERLRAGLREVLCCCEPQDAVARAGRSAMSWWHRVERIALRTEEDLWAPALVVVVNTRRPGRNPTLLWVDDRGKWEALQREGWLLEAAGFLREDAASCWQLCCLDARGWGETTPEHVAYDLAGWNDIIRVLSYLSIGLDRPLMGQRVRDILAALAYLRTRTDVAAQRIVLGGRGAGALAALFAAALDGQVAGLLAVAMLAKYQLLVEADSFTWSHDIIVPGLLALGDIPDFIAALSGPALVINPLDARQQPVGAIEYPSNAMVHVGLPREKVNAEALAWLNRLRSEVS